MTKQNKNTAQVLFTISTIGALKDPAFGIETQIVKLSTSLFFFSLSSLPPNIQILYSVEITQVDKFILSVKIE